MRKHVLIIARGIIVCCLLLAMFSACTPQSSGNTDPLHDPGTQSAEKTEILLWTNQRADLVFREEKRAAFNNANPDLNVKMEVFTEDYATTLELAVASGQAPDIFQVLNNARYYLDRNMLQPLDKYVTDDLKQRYGNLFMIDEVNTIDGKLYTLAERGITFRLIYNKDIFEAVGLPGPPKTTEQMYDYAKQITEWGRKDGIYGYAMQLKSTASVGDRVIDQTARRNGFFSYDFINGKFNFSVMKPILSVYRKMYEEGIMFPGIEGLEIDPLRTQFAAGKIGMYINGNWETAIYAENGQFPTKCNWGAVTIPGIGTENPSGKTNINNAGKSWGISISSEVPDLAWRYIEYLLEDDYLAEYQEKGYGTIVVPSAAKIAKFPDMIGAEDFAMKDTLDMIWPVSPETAGLKFEGKNAYDTYAAIILGAVDIDAALADLTSRYNAGLNAGEKDGTVKRVVIPNFDPTK